MPQSSPSIAALAAALAKAQAELVNPEKSLTALLPAERGQPERSFRYAPLSGGQRAHATPAELALNAESGGADGEEAPAALGSAAGY